MNSEEPVAKFISTVHKLQTLSSGGGRIALDFPSSELTKLYRLLGMADQPGLLLEVTIREVAIDPRFYQSNE